MFQGGLSALPESQWIPALKLYTNREPRAERVLERQRLREVRVGVVALEAQIPELIHPRDWFAVGDIKEVNTQPRVRPLCHLPHIICMQVGSAGNRAAP